LEVVEMVVVGKVITLITLQVEEEMVAEVVED